jgi:hypothetical protein
MLFQYREFVNLRERHGPYAKPVGFLLTAVLMEVLVTQVRTDAFDNGFPNPEAPPSS